MPWGCPLRMLALTISNGIHVWAFVDPKPTRELTRPRRNGIATANSQTSDLQTTVYSNRVDPVTVSFFSTARLAVLIVLFSPLLRVNADEPGRVSIRWTVVPH
jgi:hypothetical protein